jgi:DNA gyrase subunit B
MTVTNPEDQRSTIKQIITADAIRLRPKMYIGSCDQKGLCRLVCLLVLEAIDGVALRLDRKGPQFRVTRVDVALHFDGFVTVFDNGRGLPVDASTPIFGQPYESLAENILTKLIVPARNGLAIANALSRQLDLKIFRDGYEWQQEYRAGVPITELSRRTLTDQHGTCIRLLPDSEVFGIAALDFQLLTHELAALVLDHPGLRIKVTDERHTDERTGAFIQVEHGT